MPNDGSVVFEITGDKRPIDKVLKDTTADIEKESKNWDKAAQQSTDSMGSSFTGMFKKISAAAVAAKVGQVLLDWGKQAVQAASDLQEVQNVVDVTFGESGAAKIEAWAQKAGTQFGLTETQAKKFTSTLGAMMKSAGMAGPEIVSMSTDLAGLAADMASFYNLDFETAFQKIRSGISGETEPLKQLGINMSVANLQAYALTQGITKAFDKMSQSEQTMLRYQYLMQATADAQGDFARTSDGYANGLRLLETNIESLKTKLGTLLIPAVSEAVEAVNGLLEKLMPDESKKTVLDQFDEIDLDTAGKLAQIKSTAEEARILIGVLNDINSDIATKNLDDVAAAANKLSMTSGSRWGNLINSLSRAGVIKDTFDDGMESARGHLWDLAHTLESNAPAEEKIKAWKTMMGALKENSDVLSAYTGQSAEDTAKWLSKMADAVDDIDAGSAAAWESLLTQLQNGLPNLQITEADAGNVGTFAENASKLKTGTGAKWRSLLDALQSSGVLKTSFNDASVSDNITKIAGALSDNAPAKDKINAWDSLLSILTVNAEGLSTLSGMSAEETKKWLEEVAKGANSLKPTNAEAWETLFSSLVEGLPGLNDSETGKAFFEGLTGYFLALGTDSEEAKAGLAALGLSTEEIDAKQKMWLETCRKLVQTIPGLSEIINTETGEVEGGITAVKQYVNAWEEGQRKLALLQALERKKAAYADKLETLSDYELAYGIAKSRAEAAKKAYTDAWNNAGGGSFIEKYFDENYVRTAEDISAYDEIMKLSVASDAAAEAARRAGEEYKKQADALKPALQEIEDGEAYVETLNDELNIAADAAENAGTAIRQLTEDQAQAAQTALNELAPALAELADYYEDVRKATAQQVDSAIGGFEKIVTPAQKTREKIADLTKELEKAENKGEIKIQIADANSTIPSVQSMTKALQQQLEYINEYQKNLDEARRRGVSDDLLAALSDGSVESADYLAALATASKGEIAELNKAYSDVQAGKETFTDALTEQKLAADETFQGIVDKANEMVTALDMADGTRDALYSTVEGMAQGIADAASDLQTQVDAVIAQMERLSVFGGFSFAGGTLTFGGGTGGVDYSALGSTIRDNTSKTAGTVYLDGKAVGTAIERTMANDQTSLTRSGVSYLP